MEPTKPTTLHKRARRVRRGGKLPPEVFARVFNFTYPGADRSPPPRAPREREKAGQLVFWPDAA